MTDRKHIDPTIYTTRPTDERLEKENRVYDLLEELNIPFVRIDHDAMNTIDECQDVDRLLQKTAGQLFCRLQHGWMGRHERQRRHSRQGIVSAGSGHRYAGLPSTSSGMHW